MARSSRSTTSSSARRFVAVLVALGLAQVVLDTKAAAEAQSAVQAPMFEVDPFWPKPLPNHWLLGSSDRRDGRRAGPRLHHPSRRRARSTSGPRSALATSPPTAEQCCLPAPPVLEFDPAGNLVGHWGGPGQGYEWPASNHGITVDHKGNVWIGGNAAKDAHVLKFTQGREVPDADRAPGQEHGQQRHGELRAGGEDLRRPEGQRGLRRRRLRQQARGRHRRRHRQVQAVLGRLRQQARRHRPRQRTIPTPRPRSSSAPRCTAPSSRTTGSCTSATARTIGSRCSRRTARS